MKETIRLTTDNVVKGWLKTISGGFIRMQDISAFEVKYNDVDKYQQEKGYIPSVMINAVLKSTIGSDYEDGVCSAEYSVAYYPLLAKYEKRIDSYGSPVFVERDGFDDMVKLQKDYAKKDLIHFIGETAL